MEFEERKQSEEDGKAQRELEDFERKLRIAMQRREAPAGLKARVVAQSKAGKRKSFLVRNALGRSVLSRSSQASSVQGRLRAEHGRGWMLQRIAASALLAVLFGGYAAYHQRAEQRKGEAAREQVMLALRITNKTLDRVSERLAENSR